MDIKSHFSFLKLFHCIKGVGRPAKPGEFDEDWINDRAPKEYREKITAMM